MMKISCGLVLFCSTVTVPLVSLAMITHSQDAPSPAHTPLNSDTHISIPSSTFVNALQQRRLIIKYKTPQNTGEILPKMTIMQDRDKKGSEQILQVETSNQQELLGMIETLKQDPNVEYVEEDTLMRPLSVPNDALYSDQWSLHDITSGIDIEDAWEFSTGNGAIVAVLDTGYTDHVDYNANLIGTGYDFISDPEMSVDGDGRDNDAFDEGDADPNNDCGFGATSSTWHGSHVAGIVAASADNRVGIAGVAYDAQILPIRVIGKCGGFASDIADAIRWAAGGSVDGVPNNTAPAQVINLSLGGRGICNTITQEAVDFARSQGSVVIVAAGNENSDAANSTPANCEGVITVAATNREGGRANYSNFGESVDLAAPGGEIINNPRNGILSSVDRGNTTPTSDSFAYYVGTSMAAPHVAGVAALLYSLNPSLDGDTIDRLLKSTSSEFPAECELCGSGLLNAKAAVSLLATGNLPATEEEEDEQSEPSPVPTPLDNSTSDRPRRDFDTERDFSNSNGEEQNDASERRISASSQGGGSVDTPLLILLLILSLLTIIQRTTKIHQKIYEKYKLDIMQ